MQLIKKIAGICFALSFLCMAFIFVKVDFFQTNKSIFKTAFLLFGAVGITLNLLSYNTSKNGNIIFNFLFWFGSILIFFGLIFKMLSYPFQNLLLISGISIVATSFILPKFYNSKKEKNSELIDQL